MIRPQQRGGLLPHDPPPVFGKPWYWYRGGGGSVESTRSLAQVIVEMRDEIKKLEAENRELRGDDARRPPGTGPAGDGSPAEQRRGGAEENPAVGLRRNASAPVLEGQYQENNIMTVRRYSITANLSGVAVREGRTWRSGSGWERLQEEIKQGSSIFGNPARGEGGKDTNRHSLQEYVHKNRAKVKTVTFLLPVDDIYTNRPVLTKHQEEPKSTELASITETNS